VTLTNIQRHLVYQVVEEERVVSDLHDGLDPRVETGRGGGEGDPEEEH
jgi:hypothetical protein